MLLSSLSPRERGRVRVPRVLAYLENPLTPALSQRERVL